MTGRREPAMRAPDLRSALDVVGESYLGFLLCGPERGTGDDAKAFIAHHNACRAALAHFDALFKLARSVGAADAAEETRTMVIEARQALAQLQEEDANANGEQC
jgi:hypothetical protein